MGPIIVAIPAFVWVIIALFFFVAALVVLCMNAGMRVKATAALVIFVVGLVPAYGWFYNSTHAVIPVNQVAVVLNTITQQPEGEMRHAGLIDIPFWSANVKTFPAQAAYNIPEVETPAISGGTAITFTFSYISDASKIDWKAQFLRLGKDNEADMFAVWHQKRSQALSVAVGDVTLSDLTGHLDQVAKKIYDKEQPVFAAEGYPLSAVVIQVWDFQNKEAGQLLDSKTAAAKADIEAAKLEQQAAGIRADTANQVLLKQTAGLKDAMDSLGINDSPTRGTIMQTFMLIQTLANHPNSMVVISTGGTSPMIAPSNASATPTTGAAKQ